MIRPARHSLLHRSVFLTLAALAVAMKVLLPPGFMVGKADGGFPLVICTSKGVEIVHQDGAPVAPGSQAGHDAPCAFAGHGAGAEAPGPVALESVAYAAYAPPPLAVLVGLAPGRGLAAPPLPARGPPHIGA